MAYYVNSQRQGVGERVITLNITGLPSDLPQSGKIRGVKRVFFGFGLLNQPWKDLGEITGSGRYEIIVSAGFNTISIYPINLSDFIRYESAQRSYAARKTQLLEIDFTPAWMITSASLISSSTSSGRRMGPYLPLLIVYPGWGCGGICLAI